ncbi:glycosyltransferase [Bacteroidetes/Chlorobi group bacterium ChocPot_Mid]|nr:MAG: glycosyltransferase [Bacteroidetes/Chlorobi group bacterium ChocPot_Mid]
MEKLRILQLVPRFPFPLDDGGKIGIANIFKEFSKQGADVTLFSLGHEYVSKEAIEDAAQYGKIHIFPHNTENTATRILSSALFRNSIYLKKHISTEIISEINKLFHEQEFDIVHADHTCMAPLALYIKEKFKIPVGLRLHNIEYSIWKRYADELKSINPKKYYVRQQSEILKKAEAEIINEVDVNFAITEPDKKRALELAPEANVIVASAGVNPDEWKPDVTVGRNPKEIVLATTYHWVHNVNGLKWFLNEVLPKVLSEIPDAQLTLIGKEAPEWLKNYNSKNIKVLGYVDKVQPYYNKAGLNISPLFVGGGIRIKILEAMAMELPVVATSLAAEGIKQSNGGLFIADKKQGFALKIIELLSNPSMAREQGKSARQFVISEYSWGKNVGIMLEEYKKLVEN